eukprot:407557-Pelagomonas_calceolata.AAC.6
MHVGVSPPMQERLCKSCVHDRQSYPLRALRCFYRISVFCAKGNPHARAHTHFARGPTAG